MIRLLLIISLLSAYAGQGYSSGTAYKIYGFSNQVLMESTVEKASTAVPYIFFIKGDSSWIKKINYSKKSMLLVYFLIAAIITSIATMIILLIIILLNRKRTVSYTHLRAHETVLDLVCRLLL